LACSFADSRLPLLINARAGRFRGAIRQGRFYQSGCADEDAPKNMPERSRATLLKTGNAGTLV